ncbi:MAG TPA: L-seryl-tRNA(Sec) selenium transferase [Gemmatimonadaceae bacterium]|nr:L-seryl-tRNA(Sec) selenium transferase [Gemmatimonadaceae bacterium]
MTADRRRSLPAVGTLLEFDGVRRLLANAPRELVTDVVRAVIEDARRGSVPAPPADDERAWVGAIESALADRQRSTLRRVINATGVVLHTNLGRAPLANAALDAIRTVAQGFSTLEYDVATGARGSRHAHCTALLTELTGAEDALVVNNCAAALVLALNTFSDGRDAIISRGELVEIGGSFRVPDIMAKSGAHLVEVGTTNRTHADDYRRALSSRTGALVSVHRSNFTLEGFVASVPVRELVPIAAESNVPLLHDFGSGLLLDLSPWGLTGEPSARDAVKAGASLVMMSGDKLLGGPQSGIIAGKAAHIAALRRNPLARALRVDKLTLAALEATLALYRDPARAVTAIPALAMLTAPVMTLEARASSLVAMLSANGVPARVARVLRTEATVGGGAFPGARIPSAAIALDVPSPEQLEARLRGGMVPVIARIADGRVVLDLRSVSPDLDDELGALITRALA